MADGKKLKLAKKAYDVLCKSLDEDKWHYQKREKDLFLDYKEKGEDLVMTCNFIIDADRQVVRFLSELPITFNTDQSADVALACCLINNKILHGSFDFDSSRKSVWFRMTNAMCDGIPGKDFFRKMRRLAVFAIDKYNDKFEKLQRGEIKVMEILN